METTIGARLKEHRLAAGLTQEVLAERAGMSVRGIQAIEHGTNMPLKDTVQRLAGALGLVEEQQAGLLAMAPPAPRRRPSSPSSPERSFTVSRLDGASMVETAPPPPLASHDHRAAAGSAPGGAVVTSEARSPYKGLRAFRGDDAGDFFGREALVHELVSAVQDYTQPGATRFVLVTGPSGSGKSSAVLAGLLHSCAAALCRVARSGSTSCP